MKHLMLFLTGMLLAGGGMTSAASDNSYMKPELWLGGGGQASVAPTISVQTTPHGPAIRATAVTDGRYQGIILQLPADQPVDLEKVGAISFDFRQNVRPRLAGDGAIMIRYADQRNGLLGNFKFGKDEWSHVIVPLDLRTLKSLNKQSAPRLGQAVQITFTLYGNMSKTGQFLEIANLRFEPPAAPDAVLPVTNYRYLTPPTSGDNAGTVLTDHESADAAKQVYFRQYADDPDIVFDLGSLFWIKSVTLHSVAAPAQNIGDITIYAGATEKELRPVANLKNNDLSTDVKPYAIQGANLTILGRYIRLKAARSRSDFPVNIAEVVFTGKLPTDAEVAAIMTKDYNPGPPMPEISAKDYWKISDGADNTLFIHKGSGVAVQYSRGQDTLVERFVNQYDLRGTGDKIIGQSDGYADKVIASNIKSDHASFTTGNAALPGLTFTTQWYFESGIPVQKLTVKSDCPEPLILHTALRAVLPQALRTGGLYETWGAGHDLQHKFASEIAFDYPADTGPVVIFEAPKKQLTLLAYRYRYNDRYMQIGSGTLTIAGFGDKRTLFTPTGWILGGGLFALNPKTPSGSVESRLIAAAGDLTAAFDQYLAQPEAKEFRAQIKRPAWLTEMRFLYSQGWDALFGDCAVRMAKFYSSLIREGVFHYGACDSDYFWGDFPTTGEVRNIFGGRMTVEAMRERDRQVHEAAPGVKISQYTWLWSASRGSNLYKQHPEWFISRNAEGREINFFPGWGSNYYRRAGIPESRDEIVKSLTEFMNFYNQDVWYLDGGGSPSCVDWPRMEIDEPDCWDLVSIELRNAIRKNRDDRAIFFNNPENPLGDLGYLESFGGVMTTNWRDGATWMYKFKLFQRPDGRFTPLYIYWLPGVDQAFRQYAAGTGLALTLGGDIDNRRDVALMGAQQQSRPARLVSAAITPNWRYDAGCELEIMPLSFGNFGWLYMKNHAAKPFRGTVSADTAPLGLKDAQKPLYHWSFTLKPHQQHKGVRGEPEQEADYQSSRWASDFIITPKFLGHTAYSQRVSGEFTVQPEELKLYMVTQSPALVYSVDNLRNQYWLPETMKVKVTGQYQKDKLILTVDSERKTAEIIALIPEKMQLKSVTVNAQNAPAIPLFIGAARMALASVPTGHSTVEMQFEPLNDTPAPAGTLAVEAGPPGGKLRLNFTPSAANVILAVEQRGDLVWSQPGTQASIDIPAGVTGDTYTARAYDVSGRVLAEKTFRIAAGTPRVARFVALPHIVAQTDAKTCEKAIDATPGVRVHRSFTLIQPGVGTAETHPDQARIKIATLPMYATHWNLLAGALEVECKRFVHLRLRGNFADFNLHGPRPGFRGLNVKYDNSECALGLMFDFADAAGRYTVRTFAGTGRSMPERRGKAPETWGTMNTPQNITTISNFALGEAPEEDFWLDLQAVGAPANWNGRVIVSALYNNVTPDRQLEVTILESSDTLPPGQTANKVFYLKGGKPAAVQSYSLPRARADVSIDAKLDAAEWKNALALTDFSLCGNSAQAAPPTRFMLQHDDHMIYLGVEMTEPREAGFTIDRGCKAWFTDSVEFYCRTFDSPTAYIHYILSGSDSFHAAKVARPGVGTQQTRLPAPQFKTAVNGKVMTIEAAIPIADLGPAKPGQKLRFNLGRNRMVGAGHEAYTMVPGKAYINFDGAELTFE